MSDYRGDRDPGSATIVRDAVDIRDGDELLIDADGDTYRGSAVVLEKTLDDEDRVVLLLVVSRKLPIRTRSRPSERATPFEGIE